MVKKFDIKKVKEIFGKEWLDGLHNKKFFTISKINEVFDLPNVYDVTFDDGSHTNWFISNSALRDLQKCIYEDEDEDIKSKIKDLLKEYGYRPKLNDEIEYDIELNKNQFLFLFKENIKYPNIFELLNKKGDIFNISINLKHNYFYEKISNSKYIIINFNIKNIYGILKDSLIRKKTTYNNLDIQDGEKFYYIKSKNMTIKEEIYKQDNACFEDIFSNCIFSKNKNILENFKIKEKLNRKIFKFKLENNLDLKDTVKRFYITYNYDEKCFQLIDSIKELLERDKPYNISVPIICFNNVDTAQKFTDEVLLPFLEEYPNFRY